jgi:Protein of unknown function (DUF935)
MTPRLNHIKNYFFPDTTVGINTGRPNGKKDIQKNLSLYIAPIQFQRLKYDLKMWFESVVEAEQAYVPQRIKQQRMYLQTGLNEHIRACVTKRNRLTTLRKFKICNDKGEEDEMLTKLFKKKWFRRFLNHVLNANYYGYSLIKLGDCENDAFPHLDVVRRWNVSPDRDNVTAFVYSLSGPDFLDKEYAPWHIWVPTATESGVGKCGYGLFYEIAKTEILLRNNTQYNADYQEVFGQPIRVATTNKTEEAERAALERSMTTMGSQPWIILDEGQDTIQLIESKNAGTAFQSYGDFEKRMEQRITKVLLGHADGMSSVPGKLGSQQGAEESPINKAQDDIQVEDGTLCEDVINEELIPRMRLFGFNIPLDLHFEFTNDNEDEEFREKEDKSNLQTAEIAQMLAQAGLQMDPKYFTDRTEIPVTLIPTPAPIVPGGSGKQDKPGKKDPSLSPKVKDRLNKVYHVKQN